MRCPQSLPLTISCRVGIEAGREPGKALAGDWSSCANAVPAIRLVQRPCVVRPTWIDGEIAGAARVTSREYEQAACVSTAK